MADWNPGKVSNEDRSEIKTIVSLPGFFTMPKESRIKALQQSRVLKSAPGEFLDKLASTPPPESIAKASLQIPAKGPLVDLTKTVAPIGKDTPLLGDLRGPLEALAGARPPVPKTPEQQRAEGTPEWMIKARGFLRGGYPSKEKLAQDEKINQFSSGFGKGFVDQGIDLSSPQNLALIFGPKGLAKTVPRIARFANPLIGGYFTIQMLTEFAKEAPEVKRYLDAKQYDKAGEAAARAMVSGYLGVRGLKEVPGDLGRVSSKVTEVAKKAGTKAVELGGRAYEASKEPLKKLASESTVPLPKAEGKAKPGATATPPAEKPLSKVDQVKEATKEVDPAGILTLPELQEQGQRIAQNVTKAEGELSKLRKTYAQQIADQQPDAAATTQTAIEQAKSKLDSLQDLYKKNTDRMQALTPKAEKKAKPITPPLRPAPPAVPPSPVESTGPIKPPLASAEPAERAAPPLEPRPKQPLQEMLQKAGVPVEEQSAADQDWWEKQPYTRTELQSMYENLFQQAESREQRRTAEPPTVPETGKPEEAQRGQDARERLSRVILNKTYGQLEGPEREAINGLVKQGLGYSVQPGESSSSQRATPPSAKPEAKGKFSELSPDQQTRIAYEVVRASGVKNPTRADISGMVKDLSGYQEATGQDTRRMLQSMNADKALNLYNSFRVSPATERQAPAGAQSPPESGTPPVAPPKTPKQETVPETPAPESPKPEPPKPETNAEVPKETPPERGAAPQAGVWNPGQAASEPGTVVQVKTSDLAVDPARFQFKREAVGSAGTTNLLDEVEKFDPMKGGVLTAWVDPANGQAYVVNGHHRFSLANRTGYTGNLNVQFMDAPTAEVARAQGAMINLAEGRGTALDAAKLFRDLGMKGPEDLRAQGLSAKERVVNDGMALSKLAPPVFQMVVDGQLTERRGVILGRELPNDPAKQKAMIDFLNQADKRGRRFTNDQFNELIQKIKSQENQKQQVETLFGIDEIEANNFGEWAKVSDSIRKRLSQEQRLFGLVGKSKIAEKLGVAGNVIETAENQKISQEAAQVLAVYDKLKMSAGPISDALDQAARDLAEGKNPRDAEERAYSAIRDAVQQLLGGSEPSSRSEGRVPPAGPGGPPSNAPKRGASSGSGTGGTGRPPSGEARQSPPAVESESKKKVAESSKPSATELPPFLRPIDRPFNYKEPVASVENMSWRYLEPQGKRPARLYLDQTGRAIMNGVMRSLGMQDDSQFAGASLNRGDAIKVFKVLMKMPQSKMSEAAQGKIKDLAQQIFSASKSNPNGVVLVDAGLGRPMDFVKSTVRHEAAHVEQEKLAPRGKPLLSDKVMENMPRSVIPHWERAISGLMRLGYNADNDVMNREIFAWLSTGAGHEIGVNDFQAADLLRAMMKLAIEEHGDQAYTLLRHAKQKFSPERLLGRERGSDNPVSGRGRRGPEEADVAGGRSERVPPSVSGSSKKGPPGKRSLFDEDQPNLLDFNSKAQREAEASQQRQISKERLEAEFNSPIQRAKKLKRGKGPVQTSMLEEIPEDPQGALFRRERLRGLKQLVEFAGR